MTNAIVKPLAGGLLAAGVICAPCAGVGGVENGPAREATALPGVSVDGGAGSARADSARVRLAIEGMTCGSCATTARIVLERVPGVLEANVSYDSASAVVVYDDARTSPEIFIERLERMTGYEARIEAAEGASDGGPGASTPEERRAPARPAGRGESET